MPEKEFRQKIVAALRQKTVQHPNLAALLAKSSLPFDHYYEFDGYTKAAGYEWITAEWEKIRQEVKAAKSA